MDHSNLGHQGTSSRSPTDSHAAPTVKPTELGDGLAHNNATVLKVNGEPGDGLAHKSVTHVTDKVQTLDENAAKQVTEVTQHGNSASADKNMDHLIAQMDNSHNLGPQGASQSPTNTQATVPTVKPAEPGDGLAHNNATVPTVKPAETGDGLAHNNATVPTVKPAESGDGLAHNRVIHLTDNVHRFDENAAKPVAEVTQHGHSDSAEIHQATLRTLDRHEDELANRETQLRHEHKLSFQDGLKATEVATAVGVAVSVTNGLYQKHKAGKRFYKGDFTVEDWKEIGGDTLKGGAIGGVSGAAIYGITRYAPLSAPFAGAVVSATKGVASLITDYHSGKINVNEFFELGMVICAESAIVGIATAAGQTVIPIPILGAVLGSVAGSMFVKIISKTDRKTATKILREIKGYIQKLDAVTQALITKINAEFDKLGELTKAAFSFENNEKLLQNSIYLASAYGVDENQLIKSHTELDKFILR
jgi:CheY-specific phosphatase CheX